MTTTTASTAPGSIPTTAPRGLHVGLWVVQGLLAFAFTGAGMTKLTTPHDALVAQMPWAADAPAWLPLFIGVAEVAGALGLILPSALRIQPKLTPLAGALLAVVMTLAAGTHLMRGEMFMLLPNAVLGGLAAFVAWGRFSAAPIASR